MYPCYLRQSTPAAMYTFYAVVSLTVIVLATSLLWVPFVQLIAETNTIISKLLIYVNKQLLGDTDVFGLNQLGAFIASDQGLTLISVICIIFFLCIASTPFLIFMACYMYSLPDIKYLQALKILVLSTIKYLLNLSDKKNYIDTSNDTNKQYGVRVHHRDPM